MIGIAPLSVRGVGGGFGAASRGKIVPASRIGAGGVGGGVTPASRTCIGSMLGGTLGAGWVTGGWVTGGGGVGVVGGFAGGACGGSGFGTCGAVGLGEGGSTVCAAVGAGVPGAWGVVDGTGAGVGVDSVGTRSIGGALVCGISSSRVGSDGPIAVDSPSGRGGGPSAARRC